MNTSHTPVPAARQRAYSGQARSYDRDTGAFRPYRRQLVEALPLDRGQVVLDVGCGTGLCCGLLRDKVARGEAWSASRNRRRWRRWPVSVSPSKAGATSRWCSRRPRMPGSPRPPTPPCSARCTTSCSPPARCAMSWPGSARGPGWPPAAASGPRQALMGMNLLISMLHAPYVGSFSGFSRPWRHLEQLVEDVQVREMGFGSGYIMTGRVPGPARPVTVTRTQGGQVRRPAGHRRPDPRARPPARPASRAPWPAP